MAMLDGLSNNNNKIKDYEYEKAKTNFLSELHQFQKSRGIGVQQIPKINGKEVDLYLLYQIVTSHGGWEKVNARNEWIELVEHFNLPQSANGGVAFKQIYAKQLELYEKIHFLGEDVDAKDDAEEDYDDFRLRRRFEHPRKSAPQVTPTPGTSTVVTPHPGPGPIAESLRLQYGLSMNLANHSYDQLILTLQSPLPNEQDVAIGVCSLLSNETKHVLQLAKCPRLLDHLLAHAGVFSHCSLRELTEEVYIKARGYNHENFWIENMCFKNMQDLLCEHFVNRFKNKLGIDIYENDFCRNDDNDNIDPIIEGNSENSKDIDKEESIMLNTETEMDMSEDSYSRLVESNNTKLCCENCICHKDETLFYLTKDECDEDLPPVVSIRGSQNSEQAAQRITQISHIIRNLSFEYSNAEIMGKSSTAQRFLLLSLKCGWSNLSQLSWDALGNVAKHMELKDPMLDPLSSMFISLVIEALLSSDRFHIIRSLEILTGWFTVETNDKILLPYFEYKIFERLCQLLGINDIMLLIYTLECILSMTARGEEICDQFARVDGAVDTLVSLVTVEAQSYGPRGCIAMRVVETVSTIQPVAQSLRQQQQFPQQSPAGVQGQPDPTGYRVSPQQQPIARPQKAPVPALINSTPARPANMCSTSTWTPSLTQMPSSFAQAHPQPPHIPNLSPSASSNPPSSAVTTTRPPSFQAGTPVYSNSSVSSNFLQSTSSFSQVTTQNTTIKAGTHMQGQAQRLPLSEPSPEIYNPTFSTMTPDGRLSEKGWAVAWLNGAFDASCGSSIEERELYRMYCSARKSPNTHLKMEELILCVKQVYGPSIGPVIKNFAGCASLSFIEGIRPKLASRNDLSSLPSTSAGQVKRDVPPLIPGTYASSSAPETYSFASISTKDSIIPSLSELGNTISVTSVASSVLTVNCSSSSQGSTTLASVEKAQLPVSVNIPTRDSKTGVTSTSPILKATLSRPPKLSNPSEFKKQKKKNNITKKNGRKADERALVKSSLKSNISPTSSAIRSLLASKVAQRQQKKLQQPETKRLNSKSAKSPLKKVCGGKKKLTDSIINGVVDTIVQAASEECSVSSINSSGSSESAPPPLISFQGVLQNGLSSGESSKHAELVDPVLDQFPDECLDAKDPKRLKGMLVDLLEKKVSENDCVVKFRERCRANGVVGNRDIRISDKGLEMIEEGNSNSNTSTLSGNPPAIPGLNNSSSTSVTSTNESSVNYVTVDTKTSKNDIMEQMMTFYSAASTAGTQVTFKGQISQLKNSSSATAGVENNKNHITNNDLALMSDGGGGDVSGDSIASNGTNCIIGANSSHSDNSKELVQDENACNVFDNVRFAPDLVEKFNEISDLIMVSPEQLGIKRSLSSNESTGYEGESDQPPFKKPSLNSRNGCPSTPPPLTSPSAPISEASANRNGATNLEHVSVHDNGSTPDNTNLKSSLKKQECGSMIQNHLNNNNTDAILVSSDSLPLSKVTATTSLTSFNSSTSSTNISLTHTSTTNSTSASSSSNSVVQYPVTIAMNHVPNQLTFARQLVLPSCQPILLKTPNSSTPLQGQVIISKPPNSSNDQIPKAIIILQQQPQVSTGVTQSSNQSVTAGSQVKIMAPVSTLKFDSNIERPIKTQEQLDMEIPYLCEWAGCGMRFTSHQQVMMHALAVHCSELLTTAVRCEWGANGCDPLLRKRYSLMTHLQDRHCSKPALELALYRRKNKIDPPPPPQQPIHHPGYAPNAAFHAIRRHALQFMSSRELLDDNEGPVTKSIRLSAALILRNICMYSSVGRRKLRPHESHLSAVGMSNVESSRTLAHLLYELNITRRIN